MKIYPGQAIPCTLCEGSSLCQECGGHGSLSCVFCDGLGCEECEATGAVTCVPCDGRGACWRCEGRGEVISPAIDCK